MKQILVIRRDNIGDLVCTTPLLTSLRAALPEAWIGVLATAYNAPILREHPAIDALYTYTKLKHRRSGQSRLGIVWRTASLIFQLRRRRLDVVIIASPGIQASAFKYARLIRPRLIVAYESPLAERFAGPVRECVAADGSVTRVRTSGGVILKTLPHSLAAEGHEAEATHRLLRLLDIDAPVPPVHLVAGALAVARVAPLFRRTDPARYRLAVHISARQPQQRWDEKRWEAFIDLALNMLNVTVILLWSPGPNDNPLHPGDDAMAEGLSRRFAAAALLPVPTRRLEALVGALAHADAVFCADGGAMHIAAGLNKPIVCLFGRSDPHRWRPWGALHRVLVAPTRHVEDITAEQGLAALLALCPFLAKA
ncbi:MAG: glycosyltransferase family 9 protein [Burkholderiaceae bacterium]|jgi:heptosyltransferase-3